MNLYTIPLSRNVKQALLMVADALMLSLAAWLSFAMLGIETQAQLEQMIFWLGLAILLSVSGFYHYYHVCAGIKLTSCRINI
jgi:hypothetical protein